MQMAYHLKKSLSKGVYHDLEKIFEELNIKYFDNAINARITWGKFGPSTKRRRSIKLGSYCSREKKIVIHPALDRASVPKLCVERVLHHEMLHQKFPVTQSRSGRRCIHHATFKAAEKEFEDGQLADTWFKDNLGQLLT